MIRDIEREVDGRIVWNMDRFYDYLVDDSYDVMQFTGKRDKHKKEIYDELNADREKIKILFDVEE